VTQWSNLAKIVYRRTYSRTDSNVSERWEDTTDRVIRGNAQIADPKHLMPGELDQLKALMLERKAMPAGRGIWFSGSPGHSRFGGAALNNCWYFSMDDWTNFVLIQDMLMLGGGTGASVEHRFVSKLPGVKRNVEIFNKETKDADFIIPDSREGWCELTRRILESFLVSGRGFNYSTVCIRGAGEKIKGFGGKASGPLPLITFVQKICAILLSRSGKHLRPIDVADMICAIGEMVVAGNVRRSAIILLGDPWDKEYLKAKRWDLGVLPTQRGMANWSVIAESVEDLHPLFWATYEHGEAFGLVNRKNIQKYGRMGELKKDNAVGVNPCGEATLVSGEACNLFELSLFNLANEDAVHQAAKLGFRYAKRVAQEKYHHGLSQSAISKNQRVGIGITGCMAAPHLFTKNVLDRVYNTIQNENTSYSAELGVPESIRTTVVKPSGTLSKVMDHLWAPGIHGGYSRYMIQRMRFASNDPLIPFLKEAGHYMEPVMRFDGSLDPNTLVVDFYSETPAQVPCSDEGHDTWAQLETLLTAQKYWSDQSVSVTIYYKREDIAKIKAWLTDNLQNIKTISFLCHKDHGFKQAPWEAISKDQFEAKAPRIKDIDFAAIEAGDLDMQDCESGACPVK